MIANTEGSELQIADELVDLARRLDRLQQRVTDPVVKEFTRRARGEVHAILLHLWPREILDEW